MSGIGITIIEAQIKDVQAQITKIKFEQAMGGMTASAAKEALSVLYDKLGDLVSKAKAIDPNFDPDDPTGCFLTTATVGVLGLPDNSEPLQLARYLRDEKMHSKKDRSAVALYYKVGPAIVERSSNAEWLQFWENHMSRITTLIKAGEHQLAKELYTYATAQIIQNKATNYADKELVDSVYDYGLRGVGKQWMPYWMRFGLVKLSLPVFLAYESVRLGLKKRQFRNLLNL